MSAQIAICSGTLTLNAITGQPECSVTWSIVDYGFGGFDVSTLDVSALIGAFTAGAVIFWPAYGIAWGAAFVVNSISGGKRG